ncbi:ATP-binding protein [Catenovulum sp. 2E275]|uniref:ATP-binding protein n=1 Tax=Catenovulum sp. 2E275 TaxID=2980497 RepID=UPI0021CECAF2|nr:ATP-binding protein [Catenovulum sp. 2E275]MCU4674477.1 ATP-binding protein [Catenovulum sp. 2E275]
MKSSFSIRKLNPFNHLFGRLFLGFWGSVVILIWLVLFVSDQLSQIEGVKPADGFQVAQLEYAEKKLTERPNRDLIEKLKRLQGDSRSRFYILKAENSKHTLFPKHLPKDIPERKLTHLAIADKKLQVRLDKFLLTGPVSITDNNNTYSLFIAYKVKSRNEFYKLLWRMPESLKLLLAALVTIIPCWLIARNLSVPISKLRNSSHALAGGDLSHRIDKIAKRHDEIGDLARDFNNMAEKLETQFELHKRLLGDVSHELRTPLTRLELALALAIKNPHDCEKQLNRIESEIHKLDEMISNVLRLARLENEELALDLDTHDLSLLLKSIIRSAELEAEQKQIKLMADLPQSCLLTADAMLLNTALENIIRNAIKYSPNQGEIAIKLTEGQDNIQINIIDNGPGVNESEIDKIFTPFYRVAKARERNSGGTGLGLAIAQKAINRHKGKINAKNIKPTGLSVCIQLPK